MLRWSLAAFLAVAILILGATGAPLRAQDCVRIESSPERASVTFKEAITVSALTPGPLCGLAPGRQYLMSVSRSGYEKRFNKIIFPGGLNQQPQVSGVRLGMTARSLLPGWGQGKLGYIDRTVEAAMFVGVSLLKFNQAYRWYDRENDNYDKALLQLALADTPAGKVNAAKRLNVQAQQTNIYQDYMWMTVAFGGWEYARNIFETVWLAWPAKTGALGAGEFSVTIPRASKKRAGIQSLLFPGMGQHYNGSHVKGFLFHSAVYTLGLFAIDNWRRYELAKINYDLALTALEGAETSDEAKILQLIANRQYDGMKNIEYQLYAFTIASGAAWVWSVVDAVMYGGKVKKSDRFSLDTSYHDSKLNMTMSLKF